MENETAFAHPFEKWFAAELTARDVRWDYEPDTFVLKTNPDGRTAKAFTPDFYIPVLDMYIELTTATSRNSRRKRQKARLLREKFPSVSVKILTPRHFPESLSAPLDPIVR